jgi:hypothetical protein
MAKHGSVSVRKETPHATNTQHFTQPTPNALSRSIRRRALRIINNQAVDPRTRNWIRYSLGINDPSTPSLVRRAETGEIFDDNFSLQASRTNGDQAVKDFSIEYDATPGYSIVDESSDHQLERNTKLKTSLQEVEEDHTIDEKLEALTDLICRPGNEPDIKSGALLLLMSTLENSARPQALATTAKYLAFMRCCELNLYGMVDAQTSLVERRLLAERES